jgi:integrase/recombinase XerC
VKQIPTPQLVRIPDPALASIASLTPEAIDPPNYSQETLWEEFLRLQQKPRTRQEYGKSIDYFCRSMAPDLSPSIFLQEFLDSTKQQAIHLVLAWRQRLLNEGKASATINLRISALKSLVEYAGKQEVCSFSLSEIKSLKSQRYKDNPGVSVDDYRFSFGDAARTILDLVDRSTDLGIRDYAILLLLWDLALRREEVVSLDIWDYSPGRLMVDGQGRSIGLNAQLENSLDHWVAIREGLYFQPKDGGNRDDALFLSCNGRRLSGTDIFRILQGYADIAGIKVSPDRVRHSAITAFFDASGGDVR